MTDERTKRLAEIEARERAATASIIREWRGYGPPSADAMPFSVDIAKAAESLADVPYLLAEVRELESTIDAMNDPKSVGNPAWLAARMEERAIKAERDNAALRAMLRRLEWCSSDTKIGRCFCEACGQWPEERHTPDCELAALLKGGEA